MPSPFLSLDGCSLSRLADLLEGGRLESPFSPLGLKRHLPASESEQIARELTRLSQIGMTTAHLAYMLRLLAVERQSERRDAGRAELVWTGPEGPGMTSRDTGVVVRELFSTAERTVLVAGFVVFGGRQVFKPLAQRISEIPALQVKLFLNVSRTHGEQRADSEVLREFVHNFCSHEWPTASLPEVFYDPRSLSTETGRRASMHAKCIVVDGVKSLITSANLTEAAQERNIEAGLLVSDHTIAEALTSQFETLVVGGILRKLPVR